MSLELIIGSILVGALTCYVLLGGADFGAGIWTLCSLEDHQQEQRAMIDRAIGPIWEANHVWLIIAVTILFTAFPQAFALISTRLHIPLTLMLIGIILRGTAFAVRTHDITARHDGYSSTPPIWRSIFAGSSAFTPAMLGIILGTIASGRLGKPAGTFVEAFITPWLAPFPVLVGLLSVALAAYLAAVYLLNESRDPAVTRLFRRRALWAWLLVVGLGALALVIAQDGAPEIYRGLLHTRWGHAALLLTLLINVTAWISLKVGRDRMARLLAVGGAVAMIWGWALAQYPFLVEPAITIYDAAPDETLRMLLFSLVGGSVLLLPMLVYLYRLFKGEFVAGA